MVITFQPVNQRSELAGCAGFGIQHAGRHTWVTRPTVQRPVTAPKSHGGRLGRDRDRCRIIGGDAVTPAAARVCAQISNRSCERERQRLSCGRSVQPEQHHVGQALGQIRLEGFVGEHCPHMQSPGQHVHCRARLDARRQLAPVDRATNDGVGEREPGCPLPVGSRPVATTPFQPWPKLNAPQRILQNANRRTRDQED